MWGMDSRGLGQAERPSSQEGPVRPGQAYTGPALPGRACQENARAQVEVFHKIQNYVNKILKLKVLPWIPVIPVRTEPALDWELTRIPEEVLDRLSSIFTIWYVPVNHFIV